MSWEQKPRTALMTLAVNVCAKQLRQASFVDQLRLLVDQYAINPILLKLEIAESMLLDNIEDAIEIMMVLKKIGVQFSLDRLKIDQSFVRHLTVDPGDRAIVRTIITMAQSLGLEVIAEGVETEAQKTLLHSKGCMHYQGYLFGKPAAIELFEASLR